MRPIDADAVLKRIKNAIAFCSHPLWLTQDDFDIGKALGLKEAIEIIVDEYTLNDALNKE